MNQFLEPLKQSSSKQRKVTQILFAALIFRLAQLGSPSTKKLVTLRV
jgi:hypothetical protein